MEKTYHEWRQAAAKRLRKARAKRTQAELATETRYTQQMISRYESARIPKAMWFLANMIAAGYDVAYVLTGRRSK